jgi:acyl-CoA thioester hydrolase
MSRTAAPSFTQVTTLPTAVEASVTPDWIDLNGHMNIRHYFDLTARVILHGSVEAGIDTTYRVERRLGLFTAEHHLRYYTEVREGTRISGHLRIIERSEKVLHLMVFLVDHTRESLACTLEAVLLHVDLDTRRTTPLPDDAAAGFDRVISASRALPWLSPVCGVMGVRAS